MTRHDKLIAIAISLVAALFLALWLFAPGRLSDFGLNGFTETFGIAFTVLLIDHLLGRREAARTLPQRLAAFEDVRLVVQRRITFWFQAYMLSVPDPLPTTVRELLGPTSIARIGSLLDMDSQANVTPRRTWWRYVPEDLQSFHEEASRVLECYNSILDPQAFLALHKMLNSAGEPGLTVSMLRSDEETGIKRPRVLGNYSFFRPDHFVALLELVDWLIAERARLSKQSGRELGIILDSLEGSRSPGVPPCMISPEKFAAQNEAWRQFVEKSATQGAQSDA